MDDEAVLALIREALVEVAPDKAARFAQLDSETKIQDLGVDSIRIMEMLGSIEDRLGRTFAEDALASAKTVGHVIALIQTTSSRRPVR
jgi:acyl carrier protein